MPARLATTYRSNRRQAGAVVMLPRIVGENVDRLGHKYRIAGSPRWTVEKPSIDGARECARRLRQAKQRLGRVIYGLPDDLRGVTVTGRIVSADGSVITPIQGWSHVTRTEEPRPLAVEPETSDVAGVEVGLSAESISPQPDQSGTRKRTPLTAEQKARKNEQERARRAAAKAAQETVA